MVVMVKISESSPLKLGAKNTLEHGMLGRQNLLETNTKLAAENGMFGILIRFLLGRKAYFQWQKGGSFQGWHAFLRL